MNHSNKKNFIDAPLRLCTMATDLLNFILGSYLIMINKTISYENENYQCKSFDTLIWNQPRPTMLQSQQRAKRVK